VLLLLLLLGRLLLLLVLFGLLGRLLLLRGVGLLDPRRWRWFASSPVCLLGATTTSRAACVCPRRGALLQILRRVLCIFIVAGEARVKILARGTVAFALGLFVVVRAFVLVVTWNAVTIIATE
jgi:hypothetical protein